jgi:legumain
MKFTFAAAVLTALVSAEEYMTHAAVLVAGSNGYYNYRHQADVAHAYQIMIDDGIPAENIVTLMYDDVANSSQNPFPGQLFNHPDGDNVYDASIIDYRGKDVTPQNFLAALRGDAKTATGKVLNTGPDSKIFVFFADHGAPGFVCFPSENLYADDLQATIDEMQANSKYAEMTMYIEACESGSMFPNLQSNQGVYAVTASNAKESSWAAYCSPQDVVGGVEIGSCLGDLFSVNWMEDTEAHNPKRESL